MNTKRKKGCEENEKIQINCMQKRNNKTQIKYSVHTNTENARGLSLTLTQLILVHILNGFHPERR